MESNLQDILRWEFGSRGKGTPRDELKRKRLVGHLVMLGSIETESKVISIGCGTGYYELIVDRYTNYLFCLDISREMLHICRKRGLKNLIVGTSTHLPLRSDVFDCAYSLSLSSIGGGSAKKYSRLRTVMEMKRVARKGGKIITGYPTTLWKQINGLLKHGNPNTDSFRVSPDEVKRAYKQSNLRVLETFVLPPMPYSILRRIKFSRIDRALSTLLLNRFGPYLFVSGVK